MKLFLNVDFTAIFKKITITFTVPKIGYAFAKQIEYTLNIKV